MMRVNQMHYVKNSFLLLFVFSIPFEYWDPFGIASFLTVTKMAGFGYAFVSFLTFKESFSLKIYGYVKYLLIFWLLLVILSMINYTSNNTVSIFNFTLLQNIFLYWLIASDLRNRNIQAKILLFTFVLSIILMSGLLAFGVGISQEYVEGASRMTFFDNNSNTVGVLAGLAIVFSIYFSLNPNQSFGKKGYVILLALPAFVNMLLLSGSRGALIAVIFSVSIMIILNKTSFNGKIVQIGLLLIASIFFINKLVESELMYKRMTRFIDEGDTAGRSEIWANVMEIAQDRPFLGYGATGFENRISKVYGAYRDPHNLFLYVVVTTGVVGFGIFSYFLFYHLLQAIQSFKRGSIFKFVLLIFYLSTVIKAGGAMNNKLMWFLLAIILSAEFMVIPKIKPVVK